MVKKKKIKIKIKKKTTAKRKAGVEEEPAGEGIMLGVKEKKT